MTTRYRLCTRPYHAPDGEPWVSVLNMPLFESEDEAFRELQRRVPLLAGLHSYRVEAVHTSEPTLQGHSMNKFIVTAKLKSVQISKSYNTGDPHDLHTSVEFGEGAGELQFNYRDVTDVELEEGMAYGPPRRAKGVRITVEFLEEAL